MPETVGLSTKDIMRKHLLKNNNVLGIKWASRSTAGYKNKIVCLVVLKVYGEKRSSDLTQRRPKEF